MYGPDSLPEAFRNMPEAVRTIVARVMNALETDGKERTEIAAMAYELVTSVFAIPGHEDKRKGTFESREIQFRASMAMTGKEWEAVIIAPGMSKGWPIYYWDPELLANNAGKFDNCDVNAYELSQDYFSHLKLPSGADERDVKRYLTAHRIGKTGKCEYREDVGIVTTITFFPGHETYTKPLMENEESLGLSIDARIKCFEVQLSDGESVLWPTEINHCSSVDMVTRPAAGGRFLRAVAALDNQEDEDPMRNKLIAQIKKQRPDLLTGKDVETMTDMEIVAVAQMAMEPKPETPAQPPKGDETRATQAIDHRLAEFEKRLETRLQCERVLQAELAASELPRPARRRIQKIFDGRTFYKTELEEAIKFEKDYLAQMAVPPGLEIDDQSRRQVGPGPLHKVQMAVDKMLGLTPENIRDLSKVQRLDYKPFFSDLNAKMADDMADVPAFTGLAEMYAYLSGDPEVSGRFNRSGLSADLRACQDVNSGTFTFLLGNTLGRRMVNDYRMYDFAEDLLISIRKPAKDFRTQEAVMVGYFGDIDDVDPETGDYQEIDAITDEENTYRVGQKGNLLTITRKTIVNDDLTVVTRILTRVPRALKRTHAKYVWAFAKNNSNCSDGTAWFTAPHANLGAVSLSFASALVAYKAIAAFTEKDSGEKIGFLDSPAVKPTLVYPVDIFETAESIVNDEYYYASNDLTDKTRNPLRGKIAGRQVGLLDDANDWYMLLPASEVDMVEMGYLNGRQEPEVFVADSPNSEQMFVADKVRYKYRHEYGGALIDYRGGYKAVVA